MGKIKSHPPVKLIVGMIASDDSLFIVTEELLIHRFGNVDFHSSIIAFNFTEYYTREMGTDLRRKFVSFERLIHPEKLAEIKLFTNEMERHFLSEGTDLRQINLNPGYVTAAKLILASTKDHIHRIYLGMGVYAEITLQMRKNSFQPWEWTYPDYRSEEYIKIFNTVRQMYMAQVRSLGINISPR